MSAKKFTAEDVRGAVNLVRKLGDTGPRIRFIVETISAWSQFSGGRHWARVTSTVTGRSMQFHTGGPRNAAGLAVDVVGDWSALHCTEIDVPSKVWDHGAADIDLFERDATRDAFLKLEELKP